VDATPRRTRVVCDALVASVVCCSFIGEIPVSDGASLSLLGDEAPPLTTRRNPLLMCGFRCSPYSHRFPDLGSSELGLGVLTPSQCFGRVA
jgi:hypothetical protein